MEAGETCRLSCWKRAANSAAAHPFGHRARPEALDELLPTGRNNSDCPLKTEVKIDATKLTWSRSGSAELRLAAPSRR